MTKRGVQNGNQTDLFNKGELSVAGAGTRVGRTVITWPHLCTRMGYSTDGILRLLPTAKLAERPLRKLPTETYQRYYIFHMIHHRSTIMGVLKRRLTVFRSWEYAQPHLLSTFFTVQLVIRRSLSVRSVHYEYYPETLILFLLYRSVSWERIENIFNKIRLLLTYLSQNYLANSLHQFYLTQLVLYCT